MGKNETRNIIVRIPQIPRGWTDQTFSLVITATSGNVTNTDRRSFTVGKPDESSGDVIVRPETNVVVFNPTTGADDPQHNNGLLEGRNIRLKAGWQMILPFHVEFNQEGRYHITIQPKDGTTLNGWTLDLGGTLEYIPLKENDKVKVGDTTVVQFGVTAPIPKEGEVPERDYATKGTIVFHIQRQGAEVGQMQEFSVELWQNL
jgi:hypothetical protein